MEELNILVEKHIFVIIALLTAAVAALLVFLAVTKSRLNALQKKYDFFTQGKEVNIDTVLTDTLTELQFTKKELADLYQKHNALREQVKGCLQTVKIERYDAFDAMGGEMSYSILLADEKNDGVILTSIYGREESRCYAKAIKNGKPSHALADEEKRLL